MEHDKWPEGLRRTQMLKPSTDLAEGIQRFMNHLIIALVFIAALVVIVVLH